jgi:hypothetical protein
MPKPILYPKLWIKNHDDQEWSVFPNVTGYQEGATWYEYEGVFRNKGVGAGKLTASLGTGQVPATSDVPVIGNGSAPGTTSAAVFPNLKMVADDEMLGVPHRFKLVKHTGIVLAVGEANLPTTVDPLSAVASITAVNLTTNVCTSVAHPFVTGDVAALMWTTLPTTVPVMSVATSLVTVIKLTTDTLLLKGTTGTILDFTTAGAGLQLALVETARVPEPIPGVFRFSSLYRPQRSLEEPP